MIKLLYGNEPYTIKKILDRACAELTMPEMNISKIDVFGDKELSLARQYPFLDKKRVMILSLESLNGSETLKDYVSEPTETTDLYITVQNLDKRTALYKLLKKNKMLEECNKLSPAQLQQFALEKIRENGANMADNAAFALLTERLNYQDEDVNLFMVENRLKQLCFSAKTITAETVSAFMEETVNEKAFAVFSMIASRNGKKAFRTVLHLLETGEQEIGLLSLILRNYRLIYKYRLLDGSMKEKAAVLGLQPYQIKFCAESSLTAEEAESCMMIIEDGINAIKHGADSVVTCKIVLARLLNKDC